MIRLIVIAFTLIMFSQCSEKKNINLLLNEELPEIKINETGEILYNEEKISLKTLEIGLRELKTTRSVDTLTLFVHEKAGLGNVIEAKNLMEKHDILTILEKYKENEKLEIVITEEGHFYWKFRRISKSNLKAALVKTLKKRQLKAEDLNVKITADESVKMEDIVDLTTLIKENGGQAILATKNK